MRPEELRRKLRDAGFAMIRKNRHEIWARGEIRVTMPLGPKLSPRLGKMILVQIKRALEGRGQIRYS
jgi:hypothetical protein